MKNQKRQVVYINGISPNTYWNQFQQEDRVKASYLK